MSYICCVYSLFLLETTGFTIMSYAKEKNHVFFSQKGKPLLRNKVKSVFHVSHLYAKETPNKIILCIQYLWMILHHYFTIRNCSSSGQLKMMLNGEK